jgi:hypothetical protein
MMRDALIFARATWREGLATAGAIALFPILALIMECLR